MLTRKRGKKELLKEIVRSNVAIIAVAIFLTIWGFYIINGWVASNVKEGGRFRSHLVITSGDQSVELKLDMDKTEDSSTK